MALQYIGTGDVAIGTDRDTGESGFLIKLINRTGGASVKGSVISASTTADSEAILQANEYDAFGVVQEAGIVEGSKMWCWMNGSIAQVLYKDTVAAVRGNIALCADTNGRVIDATNPGSGLPATDTHFKEIGHVMQSKEAGTDVLALVTLHFN